MRTTVVHVCSQALRPQSFVAADAADESARVAESGFEGTDVSCGLASIELRHGCVHEDDEVLEALCDVLLNLSAVRFFFILEGIA